MAKKGDRYHYDAKADGNAILTVRRDNFKNCDSTYAEISKLLNCSRFHGSKQGYTTSWAGISATEKVHYYAGYVIKLLVGQEEEE